MKIAIISDIHGNLPALEAVFKVIESENCEYIYNTGDIIGFGPYPRECADIVLNNKEIKSVLGNHEEYFLQGIPESIEGDEHTHHKWIHSKLDENLRNKMNKLPYIINQKFDGIKISFIHYGFDFNNKKFYSLLVEPNSEDLDILYNNIYSDIIFYGHEHKPSDLKGKSRYIGVGSLGCNKDATARMCILEIKNNKYQIRHLNIAYDKTPLFKELTRRNMPGKEFVSKRFFGFNP